MKDLDITRAIAPNSEQLNADDLLTGPRTIRIRDVKISNGEQPVSVFYDGDDGRPWKPSKTAMRCLAAVWGPNAAKWIGMSCTVYNDETVTWAGAAVGGIRVSRMEGLSKPRTLQLTRTRGKKAAVTIQPLNVSAGQKTSQADKWRDRLFAVAEGEEMSIEEAWEKVPGAIRDELGVGMFDKLMAIEKAAQEHRATDPNAAVDALNESLS